MPKIMGKYLKTESTGSIAPKYWTLYCPDSLIVGYWAIILGTWEVQVSYPIHRYGSRVAKFEVFRVVIFGFVIMILGRCPVLGYFEPLGKLLITAP